MALTVTIRAHLGVAATPDLLRSVIGTAEALRELTDQSLPGARTEVTVAAAEPVPWDAVSLAPDPPVLRGGLVIDVARYIVSVDGVELTLTHKEFGLLAFLAASPRRVYTRGQLLEAVWNLPGSGGLGERTVDVHVRRLRLKLGTARDHIATVRGVGYRFETAAGQHLLVGQDVA